jgi:glycosyltransferase involved in cell wall biosynthesis
MISFLITTKNEGLYIDGLLTQLSRCVEPGDEIVIVDDYSDDIDTLEILDKWRKSDELEDVIVFFQHHLNHDFASHKNFGLDKCTQPWIFQIDADELMAEAVEEYIHNVLQTNESFDLLLIPRINTVDGLTDEDIVKFGWKVNENGWVMWPDFQSRIFKNNGSIRWVGKVHERLVEVDEWTTLPSQDSETDEDDGAWALIHVKAIERQRKQNEYYNDILQGIV